jgi:NAD(P)-dependent dehydrogenase (short-subunit alcohol dehydrogenase family)
MAERTALIAGASRGIGLGLVRELSTRGWNLIGTRRSPASDKGLEALAAQSGGKVRIESLDLEDEASIGALAGRLSDQTLDLVFLNGAIAGEHGRATDAGREDVARIFVTNAIGPLRLAETLAPRVREGTGVIAFMSSGLGSVASPTAGGMELYSASKAALNRLSRNFASEMDPRGVTVLCVSPGWVRTDMGGPGAQISVEESARGVIDLVEAKAGTRAHGFYSRDGGTIPW